MNKIKGIFVNRRGGIRLGWLLFASAVLYALATAGVYVLYWQAYRTMMDIWCVTSENISRAPGWVQFLYSWSNVIERLLESAVLIGFAAVITRLSGVEKKKPAWGGLFSGAGIGAACVAAIWCMLMLVGSVRLGWRLTRPAVSVNVLAVTMMAAASALAEGCFFYGAVYGGVKKRLSVWAALAGTAILNSLMNSSSGGLALVSGASGARMLINGLLMALVCCMLTERYGLPAVVGFRFAWSCLDQAVFGFPNASAVLYETYSVNLYWLSGGNAGIMSGMITTAALLVLILVLNRATELIRLPKMKKKSKSSS